MTDRATTEKEIQDIKARISQADKDIKQLRDWISANERSLNGMQETLRRITEEGITRARTDLSQREQEAQKLRGELAHNEQILNLLNELERKERDIVTLEREQEKIIVLLERHRSEAMQLKRALDELTQPAMLPPTEIVLPNNQRIPLDTSKGEYSVGWNDGSGGPLADIDLHPVGGSTNGVSRRHAMLRLIDRQWTLTDLGSTNGTYINDVRIDSNRPVILADRSRIRLGNIQIFFRFITQTTRL